MPLRRLLLPLLALMLWGAAPRPAQAKSCEYEVKSGDTLSGIAARHSTSVSTLLKRNPKLRGKADSIRPGQTLVVCGKDSSKGKAKKKSGRQTGKSCGRGRTLKPHTVGSGDTVDRIASRYDVDSSAILDHNPRIKKDPNTVRKGQVVYVCVHRSKQRGARACGYRTPVHRHEVVPGDHLGQIAGRYGVRRRDLMRLNPKLKKNPNYLRVGSEIRVCPEIAPRSRRRITHEVQSGENFGKIAKRYGLTPGELERYQQGKLKSRDRLRPGQNLVVWVDGGIVDGFVDRSEEKGALRGGVQLPPSRHYHIKWESSAWGTASTVRMIQTAVSRYKGKHPKSPKVHIGDLSKRRGGKFPPHVSHQTGKDVDVGYVLKGKDANVTRFKNAGKSNLDVARTWSLVKSFIDTHEVIYIFMDRRVQKLLYEYAKKRGVSEDLLDELFQYPRRRRHGIIRHSRGHVNHFHVRFN